MADPGTTFAFAPPSAAYSGGSVRMTITRKTTSEGAGDDDAWPEGWSVELAFTEVAGAIDWQAQMSRRGQPMCRLFAANCATTKAAALQHARGRILEWIRERETR